MMTAISMKWIYPLADCAWKTGDSLRSRRWRTGDESVSVVRCNAAAGHEASPLAEVRGTSAPERGDLLDGRNARGGGALSTPRRNCSQRACRGAVETFRRRHRA